MPMPIGSSIKKFIHAAVVTVASSKNNDIKQTSANIRVALLVGKPRLNIRLVGLLTDELEFGIYVTCLKRRAN